MVLEKTLENPLESKEIKLLQEGKGPGITFERITSPLLSGHLTPADGCCADAMKCTCGVSDKGRTSGKCCKDRVQTRARWEGMEMFLVITLRL